MLLHNVLEAFLQSEQQRWELAVQGAPTPILGKSQWQCVLPTEPPPQLPSPLIVAPLPPEVHQFIYGPTVSTPQQGSHLAHWMPSLEPEQETPSVSPAPLDTANSTRDLDLEVMIINTPELGASAVTRDLAVVQSDAGKAVQVKEKTEVTTKVQSEAGKAEQVTEETKGTMKMQSEDGKAMQHNHSPYGPSVLTSQCIHMQVKGKAEEMANVQSGGSEEVLKRRTSLEAKEKAATALLDAMDNSRLSEVVPGATAEVQSEGGMAAPVNGKAKETRKVVKPMTQTGQAKSGKPVVKPIEGQAIFREQTSWSTPDGRVAGPKLRSLCTRKPQQEEPAWKPPVKPVEDQPVLREQTMWSTADGVKAGPKLMALCGQEPQQPQAAKGYYYYLGKGTANRCSMEALVSAKAKAKATAGKPAASTAASLAKPPQQSVSQMGAGLALPSVGKKIAEDAEDQGDALMTKKEAVPPLPMISKTSETLSEGK